MLVRPSGIDGLTGSACRASAAPGRGLVDSWRRFENGANRAGSSAPPVAGGMCSRRALRSGMNERRSLPCRGCGGVPRCRRGEPPGRCDRASIEARGGGRNSNDKAADTPFGACHTVKSRNRVFSPGDCGGGRGYRRGLRDALVIMSRIQANANTARSAMRIHPVRDIGGLSVRGE